MAYRRAEISAVCGRYKHGCRPSTLLTRLVSALLISSFFRKRNGSNEGVVSRTPVKFRNNCNLPTRHSKSQFQRCFQQGQQRWTCCVNVEGGDFEGDKDQYQVSAYILLLTEFGNFWICLFIFFWEYHYRMHSNLKYARPRLCSVHRSLVTCCM